MKLIVLILSIDFIFRLVKYGPIEIKAIIDWWKTK